MKKTLSVILSIVLILGCFGICAFAEDNKTSTDYRYESKFRTAKLFYNDFALITEETYPIPGLENTAVASESCGCMTPQGLCVTEDFIFISAYCNIKKYKTELEEYMDYGTNAEKLEKEADHKTHNSVIYIIDRVSGEYIKNIVLPDTNHVGGLATDGKVIYVAKSSDKQISVISMETIERALNAKSLSVRVNYDYTVDCDCTASFVTYFDGYLWVGVFNEESNGELNTFTVNNSYELINECSVEIPAKANGACFTELNGEICLAVNTSYGRKNPSQIYLFSVENYATEDMTLTEKDNYMTPPTVQNCDIFDGRVYYLYECAATCYSEVESSFDIKSTTCAVDRVCIGAADRLFNWHNEENLFLVRVNAFINSVSEFIASLIG